MLRLKPLSRLELKLRRMLAVNVKKPRLLRKLDLRLRPRLNRSARKLMLQKRKPELPRRMLRGSVKKLRQQSKPALRLRPKLKKKDVKLMRPKPSPSRKQRRLPRLIS